ncbi:TPA: DUF551 domain-containing protein [Escherichia coli]|nr:DUF551 domain-containing protein [Escherichia coli]
MTTITKERIELFIKNPLENGLTRSEQMEVARIALASLEAEPIAWECGENIILFNPDTVEAYAKRAEISPKPLFSAPPALVVPDKLPREYIRGWPLAYSDYAEGWNDCREAMLHAGNFRENKDSSTNNFRKIPEASTSSPVTPPLLPGGFTIEDAKELHEDLVRSHISQALSGEKMKKKDRDADLRWIHGVMVQAAWFVKASLEQTALSGTPPVTTDGWISCSERMPEKNMNVLISVNFDSSLVEPLICSARYTGSTFRRGDATIKPGNGIEQATHWMPLPEPPLEVS